MQHTVILNLPRPSSQVSALLTGTRFLAHHLMEVVLISECTEPVVAYRNFNLCPHCLRAGRPALLCRLREGLPMISRSDGESFHLLLADRPVPYPNEIAAGPSDRVSVCYWYSHAHGNNQTHSTVVVLPCAETNCPAAFRLIEAAADLLAMELGRCGTLAEFYEFIPASSRGAEHLN